MTAKLATVDERFLAHGGNIISRSASNPPRAGGLQFDCGYLSPYFITDPERMEVAFDDVYILIHEKAIRSKQDLLPLLEQIKKSGRPLLIIAEDVGGEALATLVVKKLCGPLQVAAVRAPGFGDQRKRILQDLALLTGGKAITEGLDLQLKNIQISDLGRAKKVIVDMNRTVVNPRPQSKARLSSSEPGIRRPSRSAQEPSPSHL